MRLKNTRTRNGTGIVKVDRCFICGRIYKKSLGKRDLFGKRLLYPINQCGRHKVMNR